MINKGMTADEIDNTLTKKAGLAGVSGVSSDARDVWAAADEGNARAKLAMDLIAHNAKKLIGGYMAEMNGVDVLVMTAGLGENDIKAQYQSFADSADALKDGKIDAAFIVAGPPTPAITELCTTNNAYLVPIDGDIAAKLMESNPFYTVHTIPAETYPGQSEDVNTVTVKATLIVSADASEEDVYALTAAIFDNIDAITAENAKGSELSLENATSGMTVPFHKGAAKYFAEKGIEVPVQ
jgi:TRAP transporter TAXI family solute receptor